MPTAPH